MGYDPDRWREPEDDEFIEVEAGVLRTALTLAFVGGLVVGLIIGLAN